MGLEKIYVDDVSTFGPVVASQLPADLDKCLKEDKAKAKNRDLFYLGNRAEMSHINRERKFVPLTGHPGCSALVLNAQLLEVFFLFFLKQKLSRETATAATTSRKVFFSRSVACS